MKLLTPLMTVTQTYIIIAILVVAVIIAIIWYIYQLNKSPKSFSYIWYKERLVEDHKGDIAAIATQLYYTVDDYTVESILKEFNKNVVIFTSSHYIKAAKGIVKQVKHMKKYGYIPK